MIFSPIFYAFIPLKTLDFSPFDFQSRFLDFGFAETGTDESALRRDCLEATGRRESD